MGRLSGISLGLVWLLACGDAEDSGESAAALTSGGITISEVAIFQGTKVPLVQNGSKVQPTVPVVAGRDALIRAYIAADASAGTVRGELQLTAGGRTTVVTDKVTVQGPSQDERPETTFDFTVAGNLITPQTQFSVRLVSDDTPPATTTGKAAATPALAQYPADGSNDSFNAQALNPLRIMLVPVQYGADGSNRVPDTSESVIASMRARMLEFYPVSDVQITVRTQPMSWSQEISPKADGWSELLDTITQLRLSENAPADMYYYGVFAPTDAYETFCKGGCVLGLSNMAASAADAGQRASVGALYPNPTTIDTLPHELGHAHGRMHAPCGEVAGPDPSYPYEGGVIGAWGYSVVTKTLKPPSYKDQMGYCPEQAWISDYNFLALYTRIYEIQKGTTDKPTQGPQARYHRMLKVGSDGALSWSGERFATTLRLDGRPQAITYLDASGREIGTANGHAYTYDHVPGGYVLVPDDLPNAVRVRLDLRGATVLGGPHEPAYHALIRPARARFGEFAEIRR